MTLGQGASTIIDGYYKLVKLLCWAVYQHALQFKICRHFDLAISLLEIPFRDLGKGLVDVERVIVEY